LTLTAPAISRGRPISRRSHGRCRRLRLSPRIFSGIQPSGGLTLGNYLGALKRFVEKQDEGIETIYCLVDMHAITVWQDPAKLRHATREAGARASSPPGSTPARSILFNQSQVSAHAELGWIFNCVARMGWMGRMTQWKDKAGKNAEAVSLGLFAYPALMAADILAYHATHVPVGEDQKQHLELTRDIAIKFNNDYGVDFFPVTEPVIEGAATRVMSLRDGTKKMSKSDPSDQSRINLTDDADTIAEDPQGQDRPRAPARHAGGAEGPARGAQPGQHLRRPCRAYGRNRSWPISRARSSAPSSRAGRSCGGQAGADHHRDEPPDAGPGRDRPHPGRGRRPGRGDRAARSWMADHATPEVYAEDIDRHDPGRVQGAVGTTRALHLLSYVDDAADARRMARASEALGARTVGRIEVLGKARFLRATMRWSEAAWAVMAGLLGLIASAMALAAGAAQGAGLRALRRLLR
jgi:tryptophanyl-tRNA synthetase